MPETNLVDILLALDPEAEVAIRPDGAWLTAQRLDMREAARQLIACEATLSTISATALPDGETGLVYHYRLGSAALNIKLRTQQNMIASITADCQAASWIEREIHDLYAVVFEGHPNLERLIRPVELPEGFFRQPGGAQSKR